MTSLGWGPEHKTFTWLISLRRIQDRRATFGSLVPLAIFPLDPPDIADLMPPKEDARLADPGEVLDEHLAAAA
jgi:hypothetical protein